MSLQFTLPLKYLSAFFFILYFSSYAWSQQPSWEFIKGYPASGNFSIDGQQGVPSIDNRIGLREAAVNWKIGNKIYFFGGFGYGADRTSDNLADLWSYDLITLEWTWLKGGTLVSKSGIYGNKGAAAAGNRPGARQSPVAWTSGGKLYLFGGYGLAEGTTIDYLNDLWEYDPATNNWTWLKGEKMQNQPGIYGVKGTYDANNQPGGRLGAMTWALNGKLYLFGGNGYGSSGGFGVLNDLWEYDITNNQWKWLKGSDNQNGGSTPGTMGVGHVNNTPSARFRSATCTLDNKLYLFGGFANNNFYNDLWMFDVVSNTWTWVKGSSSANQLGTYGVQGTAATANTPGARRNLVAWAADGRLYLFGGNGYANTATAGPLNDLWSYQPAINQWTWLKGGNAINQTGNYGTRGIAATSNTPGARENTLGWIADNQLYLFRGQYYYPFTNYRQDDIWSYDIASNQWKWLAGEETAAQSGSYGIQGLAAVKNQPGARNGATEWILNGKHYLFGGNGVTPNGSGRLNDLWEYDPATQQWTWLKGSNGPAQQGNYGTLGVAAATNIPGARYYASGWAHNSKLYLFGGRGLTTSTTEGVLNDLWMFDLQTQHWTCLKGSSLLNQGGNYGTIGVADPDNQPRSRYGATAMEVNGKLYLFGGTAYHPFYSACLNDLWTYDPQTGNWTWLKGTSSENQPAVAGNLDDFSAAYTPGARTDALGFSIGNRLYLFGGAYYNPYNYTSHSYNDLWVFDTTTSYWGLVDGDMISNKFGVYGQLGLAAAGNRPGGRQTATGISANNKLYVFGGYGYASSGATGNLNDIWMYDVASRQWVWHQGSNQVDANGVLSNVASQNQIGARNSAASWINGGYLYVFGGNGHDTSAERNIRGDLWRMALPADNAALASLVPSVGSLSPTFDAAILNYNLTTTASSFALTPSLVHTGAKVSINGVWVSSGNASDPVTLNVGNNVVTLVVTAQDGVTSTTYTLNVNREEPLPVSLLRFAAQPETNAVKLEWTISFENNNDYFVIERGRDGKSFEEIAKVAGKGNINTTRDYVAYDKNPLQGVNYYRLTQVDVDGTGKQIGLTQARFALGQGTGWKVYPNPAKDHVMLSLLGYKQGKVKVTLVDLLGRTLMSKTFAHASERTPLRLDLKSIPLAGVYLLKINTEGLEEILKLTLH